VNTLAKNRDFLVLSALSLVFALVYAQELSKKLQLLGAVVSTKGGVALIKNISSGQVKAFKIGENVWGEGKLEFVERQAITLRLASGTQEVVSSKLKGGPKVPVVKVSNEERHIEEGFQRIGNKIEVDSRYRDRMLKEELPNILMQASSEAVMENGEIKGFRLFQFEPNSIFQKLGIKEGDVIKEINGVPIMSREPFNS
jgi:general secretion pathway protein C